MTTNMDDKELIADLDDAAKWLAASRLPGNEVKAIEVCSVICAAKERLEALQSPADAGVVVKPLEWVGNEGRRAGLKYIIAEPDRTRGWRAWANLTDINSNGMATSIGGHIVTMKAESRDAAIAAAQADYESRIISALTTPKPEAVGDQCDKCHRRYTAVYNVPNDLWTKIAPKPETLGDYPEHQYGGLLCPDCATDAAKALGVELVLVTQPPTPASGEPRHIETRNDEAGFTEFVNQDGPTVVREIDGRVAILLDMDTRDVVGYRVYDAPVAGGEQMEVVAYKGQSGALYLPHHGDPKEDAALVTLDAAQREIAEADANAEAWGKALKAAEALNTTLSEALERIAQRKGKISSHQCQIVARAALAALPAKQGGQS
ncbi:hypothetical protein OF122_13205 [Pelagibacterium flavum]|uniref:Uncharacterized protein n=1 Tax=Pelagibacterium flavum TaxID=2984530 RepID=A0ABY6INZ2_9HYPH|nr:hypothetical protein [Pelagibacterium sp. YIM 151497]UYQ71017.1 hypothetical protein OF122_13205 [Pelagibacterium sp. YIM 151497]